MEALKICLTAVLSIIEIFILTKIIGKRQISQLSLFDYINGITIGSIAAEMAFTPLKECWQHGIALAVYGLFGVLFSLLSDKFIFFRRFFVGETLVLMSNGKIYRKNFSKSKLNLNEFLTQCRINGYFSLDELQSVVIEPNGRLSFLPKSDYRPATPNDFSLNPPKALSPFVVISDGNILSRNLKSCGKNEAWLRKQLKENNYPPTDKIFLAMCDEENNLYVYEMNDEDKPGDMYC